MKKITIMRNTILVGLLVLSAASCKSKKEEKMHATGWWHFVFT